MTILLVVVLVVQRRLHRLRRRCHRLGRRRRRQRRRQRRRRHHHHCHRQRNRRRRPRPPQHLLPVRSLQFILQHLNSCTISIAHLTSLFSYSLWLIAIHSKSWRVIVVHHGSMCWRASNRLGHWQWHRPTFLPEPGTCPPDEVPYHRELIEELHEHTEQLVRADMMNMRLTADTAPVPEELLLFGAHRLPHCNA